MLGQLIDALTTDQRRQLEDLGVTRMLISRWRHGMSLPTTTQVVHLVQVTGADWHALQAEVTVMRAPENERPAIAEAIGCHYTPRENVGFRGARRAASTAPDA